FRLWLSAIVFFFRKTSRMTRVKRKLPYVDTGLFSLFSFFQLYRSSALLAIAHINNIGKTADRQRCDAAYEFARSLHFLPINAQNNSGGLEACGRSGAGIASQLSYDNAAAVGDLI